MCQVKGRETFPRGKNSGEQELTDLGTKRRPKCQEYGEQQRRIAPESGKGVIKMRLYKR